MTQRVKDPVLSVLWLRSLWHRFDPWPGNFCILWAQLKGRNDRREGGREEGRKEGRKRNRENLETKRDLRAISTKYNAETVIDFIVVELLESWFPISPAFCNVMLPLLLSRGRNSFSFGLNLGRLCGLPWPAECGRSDDYTFWHLDLKKPIASSLLSWNPETAQQ